VGGGSEERSVDTAEHAASFVEVGQEQLRRGDAEGDFPDPLDLGRLCPQVDQAVRVLEVPGIELDQLLSAQGTVRGERDHEPVA
jgi:hypothetical protein